MIKKAPIEEALTELKAAHVSKDLKLIDTAMEKINTAWTAASEEMYKASQQEGATAQEGAAENSTDDVTDVEFEEVKEEKEEK
jgi:molecular chaperone DnaK